MTHINSLKYQEYDAWFKQAMKQFKETYRKPPKKKRSKAQKAQTDKMRGMVLRKVDKTVPMPRTVN